MSDVGKIFQNIRREHHDCIVEFDDGRIVAVNFLEGDFKSYAGVVAGLSLNPVSISMVRPLEWYLKVDFLTIYEEKTNED